MNALVMRLETRADQAAAAGETELAALLWEAAAAVALSPDQPRAVSVPILRNHDTSQPIGVVESTQDGALVVRLSDDLKLSPQAACELFGDAGIMATEIDRHGSGFVLKKGRIVEFSFSQRPAEPSRTGWPAGMLQDDSRELSRALASAPGARRLAEDAAARIRLEEASRNLERLPAMAWATLRALGAPAPFDLTQSRQTADYWRSEGREVVDLLRRSAVLMMLRDHSR